MGPNMYHQATDTRRQHPQEQQQHRATTWKGAHLANAESGSASGVYITRLLPVEPTCGLACWRC
jgi:hypothetical protein